MVDVYDICVTYVLMYVYFLFPNTVINHQHSYVCIHINKIVGNNKKYLWYAHIIVNDNMKR